MEEIFPGVFRKGKRIFTENLRPGQKVYGEDLLKEDGKEYREWIPYRSKLAAAILKGLKTFPFKKGTTILYLGASTGTTVSHLSDIVGKEGVIYAVEFSERMMRELLDLCEKRPNIIPILADARKPKEYDWVGEVDVVYEDLAQPDQTRILIKNAEMFLKPGGEFLIAIKARSVDVTEDPKKIYKESKDELSERFEVIQLIELEPYEKDHCIILGRSRASP